jgi:hypothetical protein
VSLRALSDNPASDLQGVLDARHKGLVFKDVTPPERVEAANERRRVEAESHQAEASARQVTDRQRDEAQVQRSRAEKCVTDPIGLSCLLAIWNDSEEGE